MFGGTKSIRPAETIPVGNISQPQTQVKFFMSKHTSVSRVLIEIETLGILLELSYLNEKDSCYLQVTCM